MECFGVLSWFSGSKLCETCCIKCVKSTKKMVPLLKTKLLKVVSTRHEARHEAKAHVIVSCSAGKSLVLAKVLIPASACGATSQLPGAAAFCPGTGRSLASTWIYEDQD